MLKQQKCPRCLSDGKTSQLQTYQINLDEAVVLCEDKQCTYPFDQQRETAFTTFQRSLSKITRSTTVSSNNKAHESQQALQVRAVSHTRQNARRSQNGDIGVQTEAAKLKRKQKSSFLWCKQHTLTPLSSSNDVSCCFQKFRPLSNEVNRQDSNGCETKPWNCCYGSDGASDKDSSNSSQDGLDSTTNLSVSFPSVLCMNNVGRSSHYQGFQFGIERKNNASLPCDLDQPVEVIKGTEHCQENPELNFDIKTQCIDILPTSDFHLSASDSASVKPKSSIAKNTKSTVSIPSAGKVILLDNGQVASKNNSLKCLPTVGNQKTVSNVQNDHYVYPLLFPQWKNRDALCWLDVILCLAVHNEKLKGLILNEKNDQECVVYKLITAHKQACQLINGHVRKTADIDKSFDNYLDLGLSSQNITANPRKVQDNIVAQPGHTSEHKHSLQALCTDSMIKMGNLLDDVREKVWQKLYLKLKCDKGKPESPVFALPLLLSESSIVESLFKMEYRFVYNCSQCGQEDVSHHSNCIPTFPAVSPDFCITSPQHMKSCPRCGCNKDRRTMIYERLPASLLMHFMEGLPHTDFRALQFSYHGNTYTVTGVVQYKKDPDHFVSWLRNPCDNRWMKCDDLSSMICRYQSHPPCFPSEQVHIVMWERVELVTDSSTLVVDRTLTPVYNTRQLVNESKSCTKSQSDDHLSISLKTSLKSCLVKNGLSLNKKSRDTEMKTDFKSFEWNVSSDINRCSTLSTESSDSIFLPNFVSLAPITCNLLKPEPKQADKLSNVEKSDILIRQKREIKKDEILSSEFNPCQIKGERRSIQPSSVFHVPTKSAVSDSCIDYKNDENLHQDSGCAVRDSDVQHRDDSSQVISEIKNEIFNDSGKLETFPEKSKKLMMKNTENDTHKNKSNSKKGFKETTNTKLNEVSSGMKKDKMGCSDSKPEIIQWGATELTTTDCSRMKNTKTESNVQKKSRFKIPIPSVKKTSISKDAFFTLDSGKKKSGAFIFNSSLESTIISPSLTGDVSVLNSVKQYLLSRTTDRLVPKCKFEGMDLKSSSLGNLSELELPRSESSAGQSVETVSNSVDTSVSTLSSSGDIKASFEINNKCDKHKVGDLKRKSDAVKYESKKRRKCFKTNLSENGFVDEPDSGSTDINQRLTSHMLKKPSKDELVSVETKTGKEKRSDNVTMEMKCEDTVLQDLYQALNIPYISVNDAVSDVTDMNEILDCFKS